MNRLKALIDQADEIHADMPALLREPGINDTDYATLWDAHKLLSKALAHMIAVENRNMEISQ